MLYKYLPRTFAERFVRHGEVLFRSLSYFRAIEHSARGDEAEGVHIDAPDNDVTIQSNTGIRSKGRYRYLRSIDQSRVFAFCCSTVFDESLFEMFGADSCVVIHDEKRFFLKCQMISSRPLKLEPAGFMHGPVNYFAPNREPPVDVTNPRNIPFLKHNSFQHQQEYRAVFALRGGLTMTQRIVQPAFTFAEEIALELKRDRLLRLGGLAGVAEIRSRG